MKTKEELKQLREEVERLNEKLKELSEDELKKVSGGVVPRKNPDDPTVRCSVFENGGCNWTKETRHESCGHYFNNPGCWCYWDEQ